MDDNERPMKRVAILATLGAEVARLNIGYEHRDAWRGVLEMPLHDFHAAISPVEAEITVGTALARLVIADLGPLSEFGRAALHQRRADAYEADCSSWQARPAKVKNGRWRRMPPSRGQRMLMIRMAQALNLDLPGDPNRGEAAEWIERHGGNPHYAKER